LTNHDIYLRSTIGVHRDLPLLRHFVDHYRALGVTEFLFALHSPTEDHSKLGDARRILEDLEIVPARIWITQQWNTGANASVHRELVEHLPEDAWIVTADIDEFHEFPHALKRFSKTLEEAGQNVTRGRLTERVAGDFRLHAIRDHPNIQSQFPVETYFGIGNPGKIILHRNFILTEPGHHSVDAQSKHCAVYYPDILKVGHFKWFEGVGDKFTDPALIAHHSETWEYSAYGDCIRQNFFGWGRRINVVKHCPPINKALLGLARLKNRAKYVIRGLLKKGHDFI
jgi:hypothetical protein